MPTILTKRSNTPGAIPATANLTNAAGGAELAVNTADKRLFTITSGSQVVELGTNPASITCADVSATVLRAGSATITNLLATTLTISSGTANGVLYLNASKVATSGSALVFDGTNLGLGVTPSAWGIGRAIEVGATGNAVWGVQAADMRLLVNAYYDGTNYRYTHTATAGRYDCGAIHAWYTAPSGTAGNAITFTQAMTLDASGNLLVGATTSNGRLSVTQPDPASGIIASISNFSGVTANNGCFLVLDNSGRQAWRIGGAAASQDFSFSSDAGSGYTERARITSGGDLLVGTTTSQDPLTVNGGATLNGGLDFSTTGTKNWQIAGNATDFYIGDQTLTRYAQLQGITTFTAWTFVSDRRLKHEIKDLRYGLNALMQIKPREFNFIKDNQFSIGFIAQELKEVIPEAVAGNEIEFDDNDSPEERASKTMGVSKEMLIPVLVKAIQEQQAMINELKAEIAAMKGA